MSDSSRKGLLFLLVVAICLVLGAVCMQLWLSGGPDVPESEGTPAAGTPPDPFRDWADPASVLVFSGQQQGYLEECGCSPEYQQGGLARKHTFILQLQEQRKWPLVMVELGGLLEDRTVPRVEGQYFIEQKQAEAKFDITLRALEIMSYASSGFGPEDLFVDQGFLGLASKFANAPLKAINSNMQRDEALDEFVLRYLVHEAGGTRWGFTHVMGKSANEKINDSALVWQDPLNDGMLAETLDVLNKNSDLQVVLLYGTLDEARQIAQKYPAVDVVIHSSTLEEPTGETETEGDCILVTAGTKGKHVGVIGYFPQDARRLRFKLASLDNHLEKSKAIQELLDKDYLKILEDNQLVQRAYKISFDPNHPEYSYVGAAACQQCHPDTYKKWQSTKHAQALEVLKPSGKYVNPECVSCHTTGFLYETGYDGTAATAHLAGNGCENCHGPASRHVEVWLNPNATEEERKQANELVHLPEQNPLNNLCIRCHDSDNDPKFSFFQRWTEVDHRQHAANDKSRWPEIQGKLAQ